MRKHFSAYLEKVVEQNENLVFITGDLGYNALENLAAKMGDRFINAGVAEQNMIGLAAGMASQGYEVICYSIAPFVVYRCLEQVRNDVCFHNMPVYVVGNGGGYGYGIMGSSHHAIEDIGTLSILPNMRCYVPSFIEDMKTCLDEMFTRKGPSYFRLGLGKNMPDYLQPNAHGSSSPTNTMAELTVIAQSPVANNLIAALNGNSHQSKTEVFIINKMPLTELPSDVHASIKRTGKVLTIEEHVSVGGLGSAVALLINEHTLPVSKFISLHAEGYPGGLYGSQSYHQQLSGLDEGNISKTINSYF
jgi:transketolase